MELSSSVESLKGVGPKTAEILKKYGINTVKDFLYTLPRDYEDFKKPVSIADIQPGKVVVKGKVKNLTSRRARRRNLSIVEGEIVDQTGSLKVIWFNQRYRIKQFDPNKEYFFSGEYGFKNGRYSLISPSAALVSDIDPLTGLTPIYVAHGTLKSSNFKRLFNNSREIFNEIPDFLPSVPKGVRKSALYYVHFPDSAQNIQKSRNYLAYEELFELILASRLNRKDNQKLRSINVSYDIDKIKAYLERLPFELTEAQKKAAWEIIQDMAKNTPMNRLLQGDVGAGKTVVAAISAYNAALFGVQIALLAPTAILATQHYKNLKNLLEDFGIKTTLLTGATKNKTELKKKIKSGRIDFVIGTHALLTDDTVFNNLGLVVIDEQHRFGVEQRQKLALKSPQGLAPHLLSMTATPIPRSLQLTVFGDLDVSTLNQLPKGRMPITTRIMPEIETRKNLYPLISDTIAANQQVYWVCKAIDDNPKSETTSVKSRAAKLGQLFKGAKVEFLHGRMKPAEKDKIMNSFSKGEIDILVSTTVIEVGVDVPNASLMVIENAEMYGLAQLHQLRGRVGRGSKAAYCYLLTANDARPSRRLLELAKSTDGFYLAEVDLKLRGPGEIYGSLQHGALDLKIASITNTKLINRAQNDVSKFLKNPENLLKWRELMQGITRYQQLTTLN